MITRHRMKIITCICTLLVMITAACSGQVASNKQSESGNSSQVQTVTSDTKPPADIAGADKRIAVLSIPFTSDLLALGITPIGAVTQKGKEFLPHVADLLQHTQNLGNSQDPNLEALVNAEPDLIIAQEELIKGKDELEKIAPTMVLSFKQSTWEEQLQQLGKALGKEKRPRRLLLIINKKPLQQKNLSSKRLETKRC
ncbi:ABC-type Fe3+-hydroxamate transport system, periplasmic component [Paenibacillus alvei DSM 29]|nr:ABC-type Fe3+-hydroxamate transport system, periplasmic component [Paenibacillus alvei DSM 29]